MKIRNFTCWPPRSTLRGRQFDSALEKLRCTGRAGLVLPGSRSLEGEIHLRKRNFAAAESAFRSSIEWEGPTSQALDGLAAVNLHAGRYDEAAVNALDALAQEMRFGRALPPGHCIAAARTTARSGAGIGVMGSRRSPAAVAISLAGTRL